MLPLTPPLHPSKLGQIQWPEEQGWPEEQDFEATRKKWPLFSTISKKFLFLDFFQIFFDESIFYTAEGDLIEFDPYMWPLTSPFDPSKLGQTRWIVRYTHQFRMPEYKLCVTTVFSFEIDGLWLRKEQI